MDFKLGHHPKTNSGGFVYFVHADEVDKFKIGWSKDWLSRRVSALQIGCPVKLSVLNFVRGNRATERAAQEYFRDHHHKGEWFKYSRNVHEEIDSYCESVDPTPKLSCGGILAKS